MLNKRFDSVAVVGAFDRHNYGDLLFPIVVEGVVRRHGFTGPVEFYSTTRSDLRRYGAKPTLALRDLFSVPRDQRTLVIVAGGEVLPATWSLIVSYLVGPLGSKIINRLTRIFGERLSAAVFSRLMRVPSAFPFVFGEHDFRMPVRVVYNAVGGSHLQDRSAIMRKMVADKLEDSQYVSVRDTETKQILENNGLSGVELSPDCAVLLSTLFPITFLRTAVSSTLLELPSKFDRGYMCFQSAQAYVVGSEKVIASQLIDFHARTGLGVVVFAIGRASGHADHLAANSLRDEVAGYDAIVIVDSESIIEIMWIVASSKLYAGTSLHGAITALSFGVPHIALCPQRVKKLPAFLRSWSDPLLFAIADYNDLALVAERLLVGAANHQSKRPLEVSQLAMANFDRMLEA